MPKPTSVVNPMRPLNFVVITLDNVMGGAARHAAQILEAKQSGISLRFHAASDWAHDSGKLDECRRDIESGDIIIATMLFLEEHIKAVQPWLEARAPHCDALIGCVAAGEIVKLTHMGKLDMSKEAKGPLAMLKKLRNKSSKGSSESNSVKQMSILRSLPKILRFIPGTSQDLRAYFLTMQYWLSSSAENMAELCCFLANRYAAGDHVHMQGTVKFAPPEEHPDVGLYHPDLPHRMTEDLSELPRRGQAGTVGLLIMRSYVLAKDAAHYDAAIRALEAKGLRVIPAFASGLDARPAVNAFFKTDGKPHIDALVSLTGFSLVGGPAYNDSEAATKLLGDLDVPYIAAHAVEFQDMEQWRANPGGLMPVEATMMVAIPELDGATGPIVFGGRNMDDTGSRDMRPAIDRIDMLARRVARAVRLRRKTQAERKLAIVLFNFPPNSGATGTAAYLDVFHSLFHTLERLRTEGYKVEIPEDAEALRAMVLGGNAEKFGTDGNVLARIPADDHVRNEPYLAEIEAQWGPAPGKVLSDGRSIFVLGVQLGNIFIGLQPGFGYEGDPMRLLFEKGFAPTHAFSAFYRFISNTLNADAILHFGMHGALEFMPGKQVGMSGSCWPDRLIGEMPNIYLYAANNPSEGALAKRRSAATLVTYQTPPLSAAGLYRGLLDLKDSLTRWRSLAPDAEDERARMAPLIHEQAVVVDLAMPSATGWTADDADQINTMHEAVLELEYSLIPHGLHIIGEAPNEEARADLLQAIAEGQGEAIERDVAFAIASGETNHPMLSPINAQLQGDHELDGLTHALDGGFIQPVAGGDIMRSPNVLPTGRNMHGFDPFRLPSAMAMLDGAKQADKLINRYVLENGKVPESVAVVLWGTDNLKSEGGPIAQALALLGARPRFDSYGRLCGAELIPLSELGRPRIDCVITLSGIFRDLLPLQIKLLAEAAYLAAAADEPITANLVRAHALDYQAKHGCDLETAALRVFSNADGAYGANVNQLIDSGSWDEEDELAEAYTKRKCFAYGRDGKGAKRAELLDSMLGDVQMAYQNLESVEVGVTTIDHYFDTLGGISRAVKRSKGQDVPVFISDETRGEGKVRSLGEQVALETRTRMLNPKWYEGMLNHGYEGVRQIEAHVTNTMGWSATTGQVAPWVYKQITETFILDADLRRRMAEMNPKAAARVANRLMEAQERNYWEPDEAMLDALRAAGEELEDRVEGIATGVAA